MGILDFFKKKKGKEESQVVKEKPQKESKKVSKTNTKSSSGKKPKVIVYSTQTCPWCKKAKEFLKENNISFITKDVGTNKKYAAEMIKKSGQQGVPVIDINGEIIVGFNDGVKIKKALGI